MSAASFSDNTKPFDVYDWYWLKSDGTVWSSARIATVSANDPEFLRWKQQGGYCALYPRDDAGFETVEALQAALDGVSLHATLQHYAGALRYNREVSGVTVTIGGKQVPMSTRREDRDGSRDTLISIMSGMRSDKSYFKFDDGVSRIATNAEMQTAIAAQFAFVQAAYDFEAKIVASINSGKIATKEALEAAFA